MKTSRVITLSIFFVFFILIFWFGFFYNIDFYGKNFAQNIPTVIAGMKSREIEMDQRTLDILETTDVMYREYSMKGKLPIFVCIIFSENNRKVAHPPELCLSGGGAVVEEKKQIQFSSSVKDKFYAQRLIVQHADRKWMYLYWYKTGKFFSSHYLLQQFLSALTQIVYRKSSCALIRLSIPLSQQEEPPYTASQQRLVEFSQELIPLTAEHLP